MSNSKSEFSVKSQSIMFCPKRDHPSMTIEIVNQGERYQEHHESICLVVKEIKEQVAPDSTVGSQEFLMGDIVANN